MSLLEKPHQREMRWRVERAVVVAPSSDFLHPGNLTKLYLPPPVNKQQGKYEQHLHAAGFYGIVACSHLLLGSVHSGFTTWNARNQREINGNPRKSTRIPEIVACSHLLLEGAHSGGFRGFSDFIEKLLVTLHSPSLLGG